MKHGESNKRFRQMKMMAWLKQISLIAGMVLMTGAMSENVMAMAQVTEDVSVYRLPVQDAVATVDSNGNVKAIRSGVAYITATTAAEIRQFVW